MKSNSFSKKLISVFLAVLMAFSCLSGVMSANAANSADVDTSLYDGNLAYNFLGWVDATDDQVLDALLDFADEMLAENLGTAKGFMDITVGTLYYDLTSVNGLLSTIENVRVILDNNDALLGGTTERLNLAGHYRTYYSTGGGSGFFGNNQVMTRENSTSKEIVRGIFNILYMNSNSFAKNSHNGGTSGTKAGGAVFQEIFNGKLDIGALEEAIIGIVKGFVPGLVTTENNVYGIIGGLLGMPKGFQGDLVNNLAVFILNKYVANNYADQGMINTIDTSGTTYYFVDGTKRLTLEEWAFDAVNKCVLNTLVGADGEYIFKDSGFTLDVNDNAYDTVYGAFVPLFKHTLLPLFSTISLDFNFVTQFTKMYYGYLHSRYDIKDAEGNVTGTAIDASDSTKLASYWTADRINEWINADYVEIGKYIGAIQTPESTEENRVYQFPGMAVFNEKNEVTGLADGVTAADVKDAMVTLFESLDRHSDEINASQLFSSLLYSPVAEALGIETGVLNLNIKDYYLTGNNISNFFDFSVFTENGNIKSDAYAVLVEMLSFLFPKFEGWAPAAGDQQNINNIVSEVVDSACSLIKYVGDSVSPAIFAGVDKITEDNIETAILPFIRAILCEVDITKQIHEEEWNKCDDLEDMLYVALTEYLKYSMPQYDYTCLVDEVDGHYNATIEKMLPMARDALAYVMQTSVPLTTDGSDTLATKWDVFEKGGTENGKLRDASFTAFDMLNSLVVYYATQSGIAPLLNITNYTVKGTVGSLSAYESAITTDNTIFENIDIIVKKLFPFVAKWLGVSEISSEEFVMGTLVNGFLNMSETNTTRFGHNKKGFSAILYNLVYMFTDSSIMQDKMLPTIYGVLKDLFDVILGARDNKDEFGFEGILPANTGVHPITDLLSSRILSGGTVNPIDTSCDYNNYSKEGLVGILIGRIAECAGAGELRTKTRYSGYSLPDTVLPAGTTVIKMANDMANFMPILSDHRFVAPTVGVDKNVIEGYYTGDDLENAYIKVHNSANGLNAVIFENGSSNYRQLDRYFIEVKDVAILNEADASVDVSTRYIKTSTINSDGKGSTVTYAGDPSNDPTLIAPNDNAYYAITGAINNEGVVTAQLTYDIVDKNGSPMQNYTNLVTTGQFLVTSQASTDQSAVTFTPKAVQSEELAAKIKAEVSDDRAGLDETNFDIFTYRLMVKAAQRAESLVYGTYDQDFVVDSSSDPTFQAAGTYEFYAASDVNHEHMLANTTLALFKGGVEEGRYEAQGVLPGAVEGTDYVLGHWEPSKSSLDADGNIIYRQVTEADAATVNEAIRVYNLYKAQIVHRGYEDNDRALLQELLCATGDAYNYNYKIADLKTYAGNAFTANYAADGVSTVTFTASNTNADPKYGVLENGMLVNNDPDAKYTEESWTNYINALAAAIDGVKTASISVGYREDMYDPDANYTHQVTDISALRTNLMKAENALEIEGQGPVQTGHTVTGTIVAMLDPSNPDAVVNGGKGVPVTLAGATVTVGDQVATTDENGAFTLSLEDGTYTAVIHYVYGYDRTVTINVNGADIDAGSITMVSCNFNNTDAYINYADTIDYLSSVKSGDPKGDINADTYVNYADTLIFFTFVNVSELNNIYPAVVIG